MLDVEEAAGVGSVDDLIEGVGLGVGGGSRGRVGVEGDVVGGEMVVVGCVVAASFVANVVVGVVGGRRRRRRLWNEWLWWGGGGGGGGGAFDGGGGEMGLGLGVGVLGFEEEIGRLQERGRCHGGDWRERDNVYIYVHIQEL